MNDSDKIIDMTRALGRAIQMDERYLALDKARQENDANAELQDAIGRFNLVRMNLNSAASKDPRDEAEITALNAEMRDVYDEIMRDEGMVRYEAAKDVMEGLFSYINAIISAAVNGGDPDTATQPSSCDGGCESCGGCH